MCKARSRLSTIIDETEKKYPRLFNISFVVVVLLGLIGLSMLCGHFLALLERGNELDGIHDSLKSFTEGSGNIEELVKGVQFTYEDCLENYLKNQTNQELINGTDFKAFMNVCKIDGLDQANAAVEDITIKERGAVIEDIKLNWNRCFQSKSQPHKVEAYAQGFELGMGWFEYYNSSVTENLMSGMDRHTSSQLALESCRSRMDEVCSVNTAGGAMFWFTIMTTIGYGNTAPVTHGGRGMVYTAGFLSILVFTALIGMAGYIMLAIIDDIFCSMKLHVLTKGWPSVLFWLFNLWLWTLSLAGIRSLYEKSRYDDRIPDGNYMDQFWWAYISITTVGFGDYFIPHDTFLPYDMLYIPLFILMGFLFLANFALKLTETIKEKMKREGIIDDDSLGDLLKATRYKKDTEDHPPDVLVESQDVEEK